MDERQLVLQVERCCREQGALRPGMGLVIACSGGPDSMALAEMLLDLQARYHLRLCLAHYEHGIRGDAAREDARYVAAYAARKGIAFHQESGDVPAYAAEQGLSLETAARDRRYAFLRQVRLQLGFDFIVTAHHADDQAETVLMRLLRGTGPEGLAAMRPRQSDILRPLLRIPKADLVTFCRARGLQPRHDATNDVADAMRNRLRLQLLPQLLQEYNPALKKQLCQLAALAADQQDYLEQEAGRQWNRLTRRSRRGWELSAALLQEHPAIQQALLRRFLRKAAGGLADLQYRHFMDLLQLLSAGNSSGEIALPHGFRAVVSYGRLYICRQECMEEAAFSWELSVPGTCEDRQRGWRITAELLPYPPADTGPDDYYCSYDDVVLPLQVRSRRPGDRLRLHQGSKKLKDLFIDEKIPREERDKVPLVASGQQILWAVGVRRSSSFPVKKGTRQVLLLKKENMEEKRTFAMMKDDMEKIVLTEDQIRAKVMELGAQITKDYADVKETIFCVGILKGAVVFYTDLVRQIQLPVQFDFMIASSYGNSTSTSGSVKILKDLDYDIEGKHLIVIEDIIDSGLTMNYLKKYFHERKPASVKICSFLSKPSRRKVEVDIDYCGFEVPDEFLVGYGLDYAEKYRNLPYIGVLKPEIYA